MGTNNTGKQYDGPPSKFVNVKRVKQGEDSKGRETLTVTFGLTKTQDGVEVNTLNTLIDALTELQGKQANITIHMEEKQTDNGRSFLSAFARVTEMIPKSQGTTTYVPKAQGPSRTEAIKDNAEKIRKNFGG